MIRLILLKIINFFLSILKVFPLKDNQYFFMSYQGKQFSCNPRAIYFYLDKNKKNVKFLWGIYEKKLVTPSCNNKMICVKPNTLKYYISIIRSKYVITNIQLPTYIPKKKGAVWINTWHGGGAFKLVEYPSTNLYARITKEIQARNTDYYISSSKKFSEIMSKSTSISMEKFISIGMPRNDIFFLEKTEQNEIRNKVCRFFNISSNKLIVLYAPTYRGNITDSHFDIDFDFDYIRKIIEEKFNKSICYILRAHHSIKKSSVRSLSDIKDGNQYDEMQELLVAADILITDYSSCIYDYSLTFKPAFLFVPDLELYEKERGLYTSISEWPYAYAENNNELANIIIDYNPYLSQKKISDYLQTLGSYDKGCATKELVKLLMLRTESEVS